MRRSWILPAVCAALMTFSHSGFAQAPGGQILLVNQPAPNKALPGDPVDIVYYVARSIEEGGRFTPVIFKPNDQAVQDAVQAGKLTAADVAAADSNVAMRRVANALGIKVILFVSARQTREGLVASGLEEAQAGPDTWRTIFSKALLPYRSRNRRASVIESITAQATSLARFVTKTPIDGIEPGPAAPPAQSPNSAAPSGRAAAGKKPTQPAGRAADAGPRGAAKPAQGPAQLSTTSTQVGEAAAGKPVVVRRDPNAPTVDENLAERFRKLGDTPNVIFYLRRAINEKPRDPKLRMQLIKAYREAGMTDEARSEAVRATEVAPADAGLRRTLGECLVDAGDVDAALKEFQEAIRLDPKDPAGQLAYGDALWNAGRPDEAEKAYAAAASADPTQPVPLRRLARVYAQRGRFADCANMMKAAIQLTSEADAPSLAADYSAILSVVENGLNEVVARLQRARKDAVDGSKPHEDIYKDIAAIKKQAESYTDFLGALPSPQGYAPVQRLYLQAAALGVQAAESALVFLETRSDSDEKDATILRLETSRQIAEASKRLKALTARGGPQSP